MTRHPDAIDRAEADRLAELAKARAALAEAEKRRDWESVIRLRATVKRWEQAE